MKIILSLLFTLIFLFLFSCTSYEPSFSWNFYWNFYNSSDSTLFTGTIKYLFHSNITEYVLFDSTSNGIIDDWYSGEGITNDEFRNSNTILYFTLINNQKVIIDTIMQWEDLNFSSDTPYMSKKSFFIDF